MNKFNYNIGYETVLREFYKFGFEDMSNGSIEEKSTKLNEIVLKKTDNKIKIFFYRRRIK